MTPPEIIPAETLQADEQITGSHAWLCVPLFGLLMFALVAVAVRS